MELHSKKDSIICFTPQEVLNGLRTEVILSGEAWPFSKNDELLLIQDEDGNYTVSLAPEPEPEPEAAPKLTSKRRAKE